MDLAVAARTDSSDELGIIRSAVAEAAGVMGLDVNTG